MYVRGFLGFFDNLLIDLQKGGMFCIQICCAFESKVEEVNMDIFILLNHLAAVFEHQQLEHVSSCVSRMIFFEIIEIGMEEIVDLCIEIKASLLKCVIGENYLIFNFV